MLDVGDEAPDFTLRDQDDDPVALADFRGRPVVVYFYPRADTPGCTTEACSFRNTFVVGPDGRIAAVHPDVDPEGHAEEILADVEGAAGAA